MSADLSSWTFRPDTWDETIVRSVVDLDEYHIPPLRPTDVVVDIGAHIGGFSYAAWLKGSRNIYAYEPFRDNFMLLCKNLAPQIAATEVMVGHGRTAVWSESGVELWPAPPDTYNTGGIQYHTHPVKGQEPFLTTSFDSVLASVPSPIRFLKMDCESAEFPCITTSACLGKVQQVALEWHEFPPYKLSQLIEALVHSGMQITKIESRDDSQVLGLLYATRL